MFTHAPTVGDAPMPMTAEQRQQKRCKNYENIVTSAQPAQDTSSSNSDSDGDGDAGRAQWQCQDNCRRQSKHAIVRFVPNRTESEREGVEEREGAEVEPP